MSSFACSVELISFSIPQDKEQRLFLPNLAWPDTAQGTEDVGISPKDLLVEEIRKKMERHGLLYSVHVDKAKGQEHENCFYAIVTFFSHRSAHQARLFCHQNLIISGQPVKVLPAKNGFSADWPLSSRHCVALANYYLGFGGWSSQLLYHRLEETLKDNEQIRMKYCSAVCLTFSCHPDLKVEGAGVAEASFSANEPAAKGPALAQAQKRSRITAELNAFAKVILVIVDDKKATVEVDTSKVDPFYYDPLWEKHEAEVNVLDYEYESGSDEQAPDEL